MISKDAILNACEKLILSNDASISMRKIAGQIGCAPPSIYYYFENKAQILQALWDRVLDQSQQYVSKSYSQMEAYHLYIQFWLDRPLEFATFVMDKDHPIDFTLSPDYQLILARFHEDDFKAKAIYATAHGVIMFIIHQKLNDAEAASLIKQSTLIIAHQ